MPLDQMLTLALGATGFGITVLAFTASPIPAACATAALVVGTAATGSVPAAALGDIQVFATDVVFAAAAVAAVVRSLRGFRGYPARRVTTAMVVLMALSLIVGIARFGLESAGEEARQIFYFLAGLGYFQTVDLRERHLHAAGRWFAASIGALVAIAAWRWASTGSLGSAAGGTFEDGVYTTGRLLTASAALLLWQAALVLLGRRGISPVVKRGGTVLLVVLVVLLQHRTVWTIAAFTLVLFVLIVKGAPRLAFAGLVAVALVVLSLPGTTSDNDVTSALSSSISEVTERRSTLSWRIEGWEALIDDFSETSLFNQAFGLPFGSGYDRAVSGTAVAVSPHNFYVTLLLRMGIAGLLLMLALYAILLRDAFRLGRDGTPIALILLSQLLFFLTYEPTFEQGVVAGVASGAVRAALAPAGRSVPRPRARTAAAR